MTVTKILATNAIVDPVFFFPTFYTFREILNVPSFADVDPVPCISRALSKYGENFLADWRNSWVIWIPAHCVTYGYVPPHLRMPWIALVSFGYVCVLSVSAKG